MTTFYMQALALKQRLILKLLRSEKVVEGERSELLRA
jgi:hypothetical protein